MYKYKSATDHDIKNLKNNQLWVSTLEKMNDPMDLGFYIKGSKFSTNDIKSFQSALNKAFVIISLGRTVQNRRLWNYYTDGMKGFVLLYDNKDLVRALKALGAKKTINGYVQYDTNKLDATDMCRIYLDTGTLPTLQQASILFRKDSSWSNENEFRIVASSDFMNNGIEPSSPNGKALENVIPSKIVIGYKMEQNNVDTVLEYAMEHNITVRKFTPNFRSKSNKDYKSELLFARKKTSTSEKEEPMIEDVTISDDVTNAEFDDISENDFKNLILSENK